MFIFLKFKVSKFLNIILNIFLTHLRCLFYDLDPVKDAAKYGLDCNQILLQKFEPSNDSDANTINYNIHYFIPFVLILGVALDILHSFYQHNFHYSSQGMPNMFSHLIMPKIFWPQFDIMFAMANVMDFFIYPNLITDKMLDKKFWMFAFVDPKTKAVSMIMNKKGKKRRLNSFQIGRDKQ